DELWLALSDSVEEPPDGVEGTGIVLVETALRLEVEPDLQTLALCVLEIDACLHPFELADVVSELPQLARDLAPAIGHRARRLEFSLTHAHEKPVWRTAEPLEGLEDVTDADAVEVDRAKMLTQALEMAGDLGPLDDVA